MRNPRSARRQAGDRRARLQPRVTSHGDRCASRAQRGARQGDRRARSDDRRAGNGLRLPRIDLRLPTIDLRLARSDRSVPSRACGGALRDARAQFWKVCHAGGAERRNRHTESVAGHALGVAARAPRGNRHDLRVARRDMGVARRLARGRKRRVARRSTWPERPSSRLARRSSKAGCAQVETWVSHVEAWASRVEARVSQVETRASIGKPSDAPEPGFLPSVVPQAGPGGRTTERKVTQPSILVDRVAHDGTAQPLRSRLRGSASDTARFTRPAGTESVAMDRSHAKPGSAH